MVDPRTTPTGSLFSSRHFQRDSTRWGSFWIGSDTDEIGLSVAVHPKIRAFVVRIGPVYIGVGWRLFDGD